MRSPGESSLSNLRFSGGHVLHLCSKDKIRSVNLFRIPLVQIRFSLQTFRSQPQPWPGKIGAPRCQKESGSQSKDVDASRSGEVAGKGEGCSFHTFQRWRFSMELRDRDVFWAKKTRCWIGESKHSDFLLFQGWRLKLIVWVLQMTTDAHM